MKHTSADVGLIFTAFNLLRIFNIIDKNELKKYLKRLHFYFLNLSNHFKSVQTIIFNYKMKSKITKRSILTSLNPLYLGKKWFEFELEMSF